MCNSLHAPHLFSIPHHHSSSPHRHQRKRSTGHTHNASSTARLSSTQMQRLPQTRRLCLMHACRRVRSRSSDVAPLQGASGIRWGGQSTRICIFLGDVNSIKTAVRVMLVCRLCLVCVLGHAVFFFFFFFPAIQLVILFLGFNCIKLERVMILTLAYTPHRTHSTTPQFATRRACSKRTSLPVSTLPMAQNTRHV